MITADQLVAHAIGDFCLQTDAMARQKRGNPYAAWLHAGLYTLPFMLLARSVPPLLLIMGAHFVIDRYGLARYVVASRKPWVRVVGDNVLHVLINAAALRWL